MAVAQYKASFQALMCSTSLFLLSFAIGVVRGGVLFSNLSETLSVTVSTGPHNSFSKVVQAGEGELYVSWGLKESVAAGVDASYKVVKTKLCFAPESQVDRKWRKTFVDLHKDKTCPYEISVAPYRAAGNQTMWRIPKKTPLATYFVRAYAFNATGLEVAFGQSTNLNKTSNLFQVNPISGRHPSLTIAAACFSATSIISLLTFFTIEKILMKRKKNL